MGVDLPPRLSRAHTRPSNTVQVKTHQPTRIISNQHDGVLYLARGKGLRCKYRPILMRPYWFKLILMTEQEAKRGDHKCFLQMSNVKCDFTYVVLSMSRRRTNSRTSKTYTVWKEQRGNMRTWKDDHSERVITIHAVNMNMYKVWLH
jgi:hypothetical protein